MNDLDSKKCSHTHVCCAFFELRSFNLHSNLTFPLKHSKCGEWLHYLNHSSDLILFQSQSGELRVKKEGHLLQMDFPALPYVGMKPSSALLASLGVNPQEVYESTFDLLCIFDSEEAVQQARPDMHAMSQLHYRGIIFSAPGLEADVYSRCFYPGCDVPEDPVTGSAHCVIAPYWTERLGKKTIKLDDQVFKFAKSAAI